MPPESEGPNVSSMLTSLKDTIGQLPLAEEVVVRDFEGKEFRLRARMPARRQMQAFREILLFLEAGQRVLGADASGLGIIKVIGQLVTDEDAVAHLGRAFAIAYPEAASGGDPLDVFPFEELIAALVPLLVRFVKRSGTALADAG